MELDNTKPLTRIENSEWVWYSENPLETVKAVWKQKEGLSIWNIILPYNPRETTIWEADIADRYLYFVLPEIAKQHPDIAQNLKRRLKNMTRKERESLTYLWIRTYMDNAIKDKTYYS